MDVNEKALKARYKSISDEAILKLYKEYGDGLAFVFQHPGSESMGCLKDGLTLF